MKYMLMMNTMQAGAKGFPGWPKKTSGRLSRSCRTSTRNLRRPASWCPPKGLDWPDQAKLVRAGTDGAPITDGVFPESKEFLAGYWIVDVETPERAYTIAARASATPGTRRRSAEHADRSSTGHERPASRISVMANSLGGGSEHLLRELAPQVLGTVIRRFRDFAAAEDAVQEALIAAATQWPSAGLPDNPRAWLIQVASRRMTDHVRSELARRRRETAVAIDCGYTIPASEGEEDARTTRSSCSSCAAIPR